MACAIAAAFSAAAARHFAAVGSQPVTVGRTAPSLIAITTAVSLPCSDVNHRDHMT